MKQVKNHECKKTQKNSKLSGKQKKIMNTKS